MFAVGRKVAVSLVCLFILQLAKQLEGYNSFFGEK
jgi:hypothetical protein